MTAEKEYVAPPEEQLDEWHEHTVEEGAPQPEHGAKVSVGVVSVALFITSALVVGLIVVVAIYFNSYFTQMRHERIEITTTADAHQAQRAGAQSELSRFGWIDTDAGVVRVPVDIATDLVIEQYAENRGD